MGKKSTAPNHLHKYKRVNLTRDPAKKEYLVFRCTKPLCSHYVPVTLALGKLCECNRCGDAMVIDKVSVGLALPHCPACTKRKQSNEEAVDIVAQFLKEHGDVS